MSNEFIPKDFGKRLKEERIKKNYTQKELAKEIYTSDSNISSLERGLSSPTAEVIKRLAIKIEASADYLLGIETNISQKLKQSNISNEELALYEKINILILNIIHNRGNLETIPNFV